MSQNLISEKFLTQNFDEQETVTQTASPAPDPNQKPRQLAWPHGLTVICVLFAIISTFGLFGAVSGITKLISFEQEKADLSHLGRSYGDRKKAKEIRKLEKKAMDTRKKYLPFYAYLELLKLGVSLAFAVSVGLLLARNPKARKFAMVTCFVALFFHVSSVGIAFFASMEVLGPVSQFIETAAQDPNELKGLSRAERTEVAETAQRVVGGIAIFLVGFYLLTKFVFYGAVLAYFWQHEIKLMYDGREDLAEGALAVA